MNELALFAGAGGGILGGILLGWKTVCAVEIDSYAASVLCARQNDGILPPFPIWDDIQTFDGKPWRGIVDVVSGGFPCQDISAAGKGSGINGKQSGLWREMARIIGEVRPRFVLVENSPMLTVRGLGRVLGDLAEMGYNAKWGVLGADNVGAPHIRKRIWIVAYTNGAWQLQSEGGICEQWKRSRNSREAVADAYRSRFIEQWRTIPSGDELTESQFCGWWKSEPDMGRVANGVAARMDRLKAIGNGQVPSVVKLAWETLKP